MVNVKGALVSRDVFVVFGQWDMGNMQHMISGDGLPWNDPLGLTAVKRVFEATSICVFGGRRTEFMRII
jgi:hypothetical protein